MGDILLGQPESISKHQLVEPVRDGQTTKFRVLNSDLSLRLRRFVQPEKQGEVTIVDGTIPDRLQFPCLTQEYTSVLRGLTASLENALEIYTAGLTPLSSDSAHLAYQGPEGNPSYQILFHISHSGDFVLAAPSLTYTFGRKVHFEPFLNGPVYEKIFDHIFRESNLSSDIIPPVRVSGPSFRLLVEPIPTDNLSIILDEFGAAAQSLEEYTPQITHAAFLLAVAGDVKKRASSMVRASPSVQRLASQQIGTLIGNAVDILARIKRSETLEFDRYLASEAVYVH